MIRRLYNTNKYLPFFVISLSVFLLVVAIGAVVLICLHGSIAGAMKYFSHYALSDFGQVMYFTLNENPYVSNFPTMYPPLNFVLMLPFALVCKNAPEFYVLDNISIDENGMYNYEQLLDYNVGILSTWQFWIAIILFFTVCLTVCGLIIKRMRTWGKGEFFYFYLGLIFSGFIMFGLFRGTNLFLSLIFILLFVWLYKSEKKHLREIALVSLAIGGVLKLYPLLFGVLLLKEKRFIDVIKVAVYSLLLMFLPFLMYPDSISTALEFVKNMFSFVGGENRVGDGMNISISSLVSWILNLIKVPANVTSVVSILFTIIAFALCVITTLKSKNEFVTSLVTAIGVLIIPPVSYYYVCAFMLVSLLHFENEWNKFSKPRKIYYTIFFITMSFLPLSASMWYIPQCIMMAVILVWEFVRVFSAEKLQVFPNEKNMEEN